MMRIFTVACLLMVASLVRAQTLFRSNGTGGGTWGVNTTWQTSTDGGITWAPAGAGVTPDFNSGTIEILSPDVVTVSAAVTIDQTTVDIGATLTVNNVTLTLNNAPPALTVNGSLTLTGAAGTLSGSSITNLAVNGTYTHARTTGTVPTATWGTGSFCVITGSTAAAPAGLNQSFDSFTWNATGQSGTISLAGNLTSVAADLLVSSTNGQILQLATTTAPTIAIGGSFTVNGNSRIAFITTGTGAVVNVGVDFNYNSTNATTSVLKSSGTYTLTVNGIFSMNSVGGISLSSGTSNGTLNLLSDFTITAGTLTRSGGRGVINFNKSGTQVFTNNGTMSSTIDVNIASTSTLDMQAESPIAGTGNLVVNGTIRLGSLAAAGALQASTTLGNIRNSTANRTYNSGSRIVYAGLGAQLIGSGHPNTAGVITEIDNVNGVSFTTAAGSNGVTNTMTIPSDLILTNGSFNLVSSGGTTRILSLNGNITAGVNNITISGTTSDLTINGTGALGTFPFPAGAQSFRNLIFNRTTGSMTFANALTITGTTAINNGTVTFGGTTTLTGNVTLATGTVLAFDGQALSMAGSFTATGTGALSASGASTLSMSSGSNITSSLVFLNTNNTLQSLTMNYTNAGGTVQIASALNVTSFVTLTEGTLNIVASNLNMSSGSTINLAATGTSPSSITTSSPSGGPWNLNYSSTASKTTGLEIPASGALLSLTSSNTATITLSQAITVGSGGISQSAGTISCGANTVSSSTLTQTAGTFTAPSTTLTLTGNLSIAGTFTNNGGTVVFNGNSTIGGANASTTNFNSITINGGASMTGPTTLNVQGNFSNSGTFVAGTNTVNFSGTNVQTVSGTSDILFYNFTVNKTGGSLTVNSAESISNNLTLTAGTLNISAAVSMTSATGLLTLTAGTMAINTSLTLANGATISRAAGTITTNRPSGGPWNVIYTGGSKTTAFEIPASGNVISVTLNNNNTTTITLAASQPLTVSGAFTITSAGRTFSTGANAISVGSLSNNGTVTATTATSFAVLGTMTNAGTFTAPTATLTLNGAFSNTGTFTNSSGTVAIGGAVSITGTVPTFFNFTINSTGTFTAPAAITIQGNLQNDGSFVAGTGTVTLSGNTTKNIQGSSKIVFNNLTISGNGACIRYLENTVGADLKGVLTLTSAGGNPIFHSEGVSNNRVFTLLSTADKPTSDASIAAVASSTQLPGKMTVQRYLGRYGDVSFAYQTWRDISSPVNSTVADLLNPAKASGLYLPVTGSFTGASTVSGASGPSLYNYAETTVTDTNGDGVIDLNDGWFGFPTTTAATAFTKGQGYQLFIFGSDPPVSTNLYATYDLTGIPNSGNISLPVSYTVRDATHANSDYNNGWNFVGNPYPSAIDWKAAAGWTKTNINDAIYIDDYSTANPVFATFVNGVGTNNGSRYIGMGQGFWVKANAASPALSVTESVKVPGQSTYVFRQATPTDLLRVSLQTSSNLRDETVIYFTDSATVGFDSKYDALKLNNQYGWLNLSSLSTAQEKYAINGLPVFTNCAYTVPLSVTDLWADTFSLVFSDFGGMSSAIAIQLKDAFTNTVVDVRQNPTYSFTVDPNNALTFGSNRFSVTFTYQPANKSLDLLASNICDPATAGITVSNSSADYMYSVLSPANGSTLVSAVQGNNGNLLLALPATSVASGTNQYQVQMINRFCSSISSTSTTSFVYSPIPIAPTAVSSTSCGTGTVTLTASGASSDGHYNWYDSLNATTPYAVQTASFTTPSLSKPKTYYVSTSNGLGCEGDKAAVDANVVVFDPAAITVLDLSTLQSNYATGNQWYFNGSPISGATGNTLKVTQSGSYKLVVNYNTCSTDATLEFIVTADAPLQGMRVYPNPVKDKFTLEVGHDNYPTAELMNSLGKSLAIITFEDDGTKYFTTINLGNESSGMYLVKVSQNNKTTVIKVIKN